MLAAYEWASFGGRKFKSKEVVFLFFPLFFYSTLTVVVFKEEVWREFMVSSVALVCLWHLNGMFALSVRGGQFRSSVNRWLRGLCFPFPDLQKISLWDIAPFQFFVASPHDWHTALKLTSNTNYFKEDVLWTACCSTMRRDSLEMYSSLPLILLFIPSQRSALRAARPVSFANVIESRLNVYYELHQVFAV